MQVKTRWFSAASLVVTLSASLFAQSNSLLPAKSEKKKAVPASSTQKELKNLRDLVIAQQKQLEAQRQQVEQVREQLQQLLDSQQQASTASQRNAEQTAATASQAQTTATQAQQSAEEAQRLATQAAGSAVEVKTALVEGTRKQRKMKRSSLPAGNCQPLSFQRRHPGRGESIFQDGVADRNRGRIRVRFGLEGKLNDDFVGGIALATGTLGDPTTTNETFTNFFDRKTVALDKGYVIYQPQAHKWLQATGGKFAYTWNRTAVTGDPDINPEGFSEKLSWDFKTPVLKNFTLQAMQLLFNEVTAGTDSYALGGQVATKLQFGRFTSIPSFMALKWNNPDPILQASAFAVAATTTTGGLPVPGEGPGCARGIGLSTAPPCAFSANGMTNATYNDASGKPHFYSQYLYADLILNNQIKTGSERWPVNLIPVSMKTI